MCSLLTPVPKDNEMSGDDGTALMRPVSVRDGDTVGVAVQQSDLPMIQFLGGAVPHIPEGVDYSQLVIRNS